jgi:hypothetical protein
MHLRLFVKETICKRGINLVLTQATSCKPKLLQTRLQLHLLFDLKFILILQTLI